MAVAASRLRPCRYQTEVLVVNADCLTAAFALQDAGLRCVRRPIVSFCLAPQRHCLLG
jgi:hypothetical protein